MAKTIKIPADYYKRKPELKILFLGEDGKFAINPRNIQYIRENLAGGCFVVLVSGETLKVSDSYPHVCKEWEDLY